MAIPNVPTNVLVTPGNGRVYISWAPQVGATSASTGVPSGSTGKYDVVRSFDGLNFHLLTSINQLEYYDTPSTGIVLSYGVRANGNNGQSSYSAPISTTVVNFGQTTLGAVRLAAQQRADMVNNDFVTKAEWNDYIDKSYTELYDLLVQVYADDYYVATPFSISADGRDPALYNLPSNFYKLLGGDLQAGSGWITLRKFSFINRNNYSYLNTSATTLGNITLRYRILGQQIEFMPVPGGNQTIRLWYIPRPTKLLADYDVLDGISGWDEYVIVDAAIKALQKEESDASLLLAQKQALKQRIEAAASNRDVAFPEQASDVRGMIDGVWGWNGINGNGVP